MRQLTRLSSQDIVILTSLEVEIIPFGINLERDVVNVKVFNSLN